MSIILKGIDIPSKNAKDYIVISWYETNTHGGLDLKSKFVECADIVQIPKDHGRIIDGDELLSHLSKDPLFDLVERYGVSGVIESRPTILEAEE